VGNNSPWPYTRLNKWKFEAKRLIPVYSALGIVDGTSFLDNKLFTDNSQVRYCNVPKKCMHIAVIDVNM
jgi:hypothetical protein